MASYNSNYSDRYTYKISIISPWSVCETGSWRRCSKCESQRKEFQCELCYAEFHHRLIRWWLADARGMIDICIVNIETQLIVLTNEYQNQQDSTECPLMLISITHKGSLPDSSLTTYPMGASLSDILFSFVLKKYIVWDVCGLRSPSFVSSSVLYISPTNTSSMQNLILQGLQQKLQKSCSRCNKNTWHVESSYISQPPKYLFLFVNRFRYINDNVTKDRCSIPMDTTVRLGPLKFSLRATIDHHGPSIHSGHYTVSINCCKKTFYCNDHTITEFGIIDSKNSSTAYVILYELIDTWFLDSNRRVGV